MSSSGGARDVTRETRNDVGPQITLRNLNIQPTLKVWAGFPIGDIVNNSLVLRLYQAAPFTANTIRCCRRDQCDLHRQSVMGMLGEMADIGAVRAPLFVPADRPDRFDKAARSGADAVILDLEDAVAFDAKDAARSALRCDFTDLPVIVRINGAGSQAHEADLIAVAALSPTAVIVPKAEDLARLEAVTRALHSPIIALIESARGLAHARQIAAAKGVARLAFGSVDFCADLGCAHRREVLAPARFELVLASRLAGIAAPIDGVTVRLDSPSEAQDDAAHARDMGMSGKLCIHPAQVDFVLRSFSPSEAEIAWARRVLASGDGAVLVDGAMVDEPVRIRARAIMRATDRKK